MLRFSFDITGNKLHFKIYNLNVKNNTIALLFDQINAALARIRLFLFYITNLTDFKLLNVSVCI